jgi:hypothetical protein
MRTVPGKRGDISFYTGFHRLAGLTRGVGSTPRAYEDYAPCRHIGKPRFHDIRFGRPPRHDGTTAAFKSVLDQRT